MEFFSGAIIQNEIWTPCTKWNQLNLGCMPNPRNRNLRHERPFRGTTGRYIGLNSDCRMPNQVFGRDAKREHVLFAKSSVFMI